ncbi:MAG: hypothetical protein NT031_10890, partial [Planctomycetota bacterium]|nr:hypothetical protein [Planctomycetota bacterium]
VACGDEQAQAGKASEATALYHKGQDIAASVDPTRVDSIAGKIKRLSSPGGPAGEKPRRDLPGSPDAATQAAIEKAAKFLWSIQQPDGSWHEWSTNGPNGGQLRDYYQTYTDGTTALVAHALMESGVPPTDKRMAKALVWLERIAARNAAGAYTCELSRETPDN